MVISLKDIKKALSDKLRPDSSTLLPKYYYNFLNIFSRADSNKLAEYRLYNYNISLMPGIEPPTLLLYNYSQDELRII